ncbi:MAG TPA: ATP-binding protein, partial [Polyangia bacterium]|nr:ATP-binding protein [Polyangia bacterium]
MGIFVGREAQLGRIAEAIDDAAAGRGRLVLVAGEPGIGKTSLADAATAAATARGFVALWGRCWEAGGAPAYWPWLDVLAAVARLVDDRALAAALGEGAGLAAELLPEVAA